MDVIDSLNQIVDYIQLALPLLEYFITLAAENYKI